MEETAAVKTLLKPIKVPSGELTLVSPRNHYIRWGRDPSTEKGNLGGFVRRIEKHWKSAAVYAAKAIIQSQ